MILCLLTLIGLPLYFYCTFASTNSHLINLQKENNFIENSQLLINTSTCVLADYPLFDEEILQNHYSNKSGQEYSCDKNLPPFSIFRLNYTWIGIEFPKESSSWTCFAREIYRPEGKDGVEYGTEEVGPLNSLTNFANNLTSEEATNNNTGRWDSVKVECKQSSTNSTYTRIVPLVQKYHSKVSQKRSKKPWFIFCVLLGIFR